MIASLPMYDRPETMGANDRLWHLIRQNLHLETRTPPERLTRTGDLWAQWQSPDLVLSQTCGLPYRTRLHGKVALVATPVHDLPCAPGYYFSVLVARADDPRRTLSDFESTRIAVNDVQSQSGWAAPRTLAADHGFAFREAVVTGSHRASADAVAAGIADLAGIDAVTWRMMRRWDPVSEALHVVAETPPTPALPYISARGRDATYLRNAIGDAIARLDGEDRETLCLIGVAALHPDLYLAVPTPGPPGKVLNA